MRLSGQFQACFFFFHEKILSVKKNTKTQNKLFSLSEKLLCAQKIVALVAFYSLIFVLLVGFCLWHVFLLSKTFREKKINRLEIVPVTSFTILLKCTPINPPIKNLFVCTYFICDHLRESLFLWECFWIVLICENIFFFIIIYLCESMFL